MEQYFNLWDHVIVTIFWTFRFFTVELVSIDDAVRKYDPDIQDIMIKTDVNNYTCWMQLSDVLKIESEGDLFF